MGSLLFALLLAQPFKDVFDPKVQEQIAAQVAKSCRWMGEASWTEAWVSAIRKMPSGQPGKEQYLVFLKETYVYNIGALNQAYGLDASSFTDLASVDFSKLDGTRSAVRADDRQFLGWIANAVYQTVAVQLRRCDGNKEATSEPLTSGIPESVVIEAGKAFDRLVCDASSADRIRRLTKKPVVIVERSN